MDKADKKCKYRKIAAQAALLVAAFAMIVYGVSRGEVSVVLTKAINICMECIGLG